MRRITLSLIVCIIVTIFLFRYSTATGTQHSGEGSAPVLIYEIRELRRSLQSFAASNQRALIAIERLRLQQAKVNRLNDEQATMQSQLEENAATIAQAEEAVNSLETQIAAESDMQRRNELERTRKAAVQSLELSKQREQQLRARGIQLDGFLQTEQAKLAHLDNQMDALERSLESQSPDTR